MQNPIRVLVVDEPAEARDLAHDLGDAGFVTVHCGDADAATRHASTFRPDAVVTFAGTARGIEARPTGSSTSCTGAATTTAPVWADAWAAWSNRCWSS